MILTQALRHDTGIPMSAINFVKEAAASGQSIRGIHLTFAAPSVIEVLAAADLQFVYIDGEHGCFDWRDIEAACITSERHNLTPIARIPDMSSATITRFLDRGVRGLVLPHVESVDDARSAIDAAYFAPLGQPLLRRRPSGIWPAHRQPAGVHASLQCRALGVRHDRKPAWPRHRARGRGAAGCRLPELRDARPRAIARPPGQFRASRGQGRRGASASTASTARASACARTS